MFGAILEFLSWLLTLMFYIFLFNLVSGVILFVIGFIAGYFIDMNVWLVYFDLQERLNLMEAFQLGQRIVHEFFRRFGIDIYEQGGSPVGDVDVERGRNIPKGPDFELHKVGGISGDGLYVQEVSKIKNKNKRPNKRKIT